MLFGKGWGAVSEGCVQVLKEAPGKVCLSSTTESVIYLFLICFEICKLSLSYKLSIGFE